MIGYKVVENSHGELRSFTAGILCPAGTHVVYVPGQKARPNPGCGPLCVFGTEDDARSVRLASADQVWKCEYDPSNATGIWARDLEACVLSLSLLPQGTVLADSVTLLERIK